jgi:hypothetical protein
LHHGMACGIFSFQASMHCIESTALAIVSHIEVH